MCICVDRIIRTRAAALYAAVWPETKRTLTLSFRGGDKRLYSRIFEAAQVWSEHCGMRFVIGREWSVSDIRIDIGNDASSWSYLGTQAQLVPPQEMTMHFGWLDRFTSDQELNRVVQHEFGHALGMIHEHQNPAGGIQWDKEMLYEMYAGPPNFWNKETVDTNILSAYDEGMTNFTEFDPHSIMLYPIAPEMTLNGFSVGWNTTISDKDKELVARLYPKG